MRFLQNVINKQRRTLAACCSPSKHTAEVRTRRRPENADRHCQCHLFAFLIVTDVRAASDVFLFLPSVLFLFVLYCVCCWQINHSSFIQIYQLLWCRHGQVYHNNTLFEAMLFFLVKGR